MSRLALLHLDATSASLWRSDAEPPVVVPWNPSEPGIGLDAIGGLAGTGLTVVLVIGLPFLECAEVMLPPVDPAQQRRILRADAARFFAIEGPVAVGIAGTAAWAASAEWLARCRASVVRWARVEAVVALPSLLARSNLRGTLVLASGPSAHGVLTVGDGHVRELRHMGGAPQEPPHQIDWATLYRRATRWQWPPADQLLDDSTEEALHSSRRWRMALGWLAFAASLWGIARAVELRADRRLGALTTQVRRLETAAAAAVAAQARLQRTQEERQQLTAPAGVESPLAVLVRLGERLPADVVLQELGWDGDGWRLQGSARNAETVLPRLSAAGFADVRSLAPTTRFVEGGRQRSSFTVGFRTPPVATPSAGRDR